MSDNRDIETETCEECCLPLLIVMSIPTAALVYVIVTIVGLSTEWNGVGHCESSHLRELTIIHLTLWFLLINWIRVLLGEPYDKIKYVFINTLFLICVINICFTIWSSLEIFLFSCPNIKHMLLYGVGFAIFIVNGIGSLYWLFMSNFVLVVMFDDWHKKRNQPEHTPEQIIEEV